MPPDDPDVPLIPFTPNTVLLADQLNVLVTAIERLRVQVRFLSNRIDILEKKDDGKPITLFFVPRSVLRFRQPIPYPVRVYRDRGAVIPEDVTAQCEVRVGNQNLGGALIPESYAGSSQIAVVVTFRSKDQDQRFLVPVEMYDPRRWEFNLVKFDTGRLVRGHTGMIESCTSARSGLGQPLCLSSPSAGGTIDSADLLPHPGASGELVLLVQSPTEPPYECSVAVQAASGETLLDVRLPLLASTSSPGKPNAQFCEVPVNWIGVAGSIKVGGGGVLAVGRRLPPR